LKIFLPISSVFMLLGGFKTFMDYFSNGPITTGSLLALITGILIFSLGLISDQISQIRTESFDKKY
ncbi:MAG: glycosyl transferase, partial [Rhizobiales bacterium]|nr:glycosyl transferase [Hyphomicrobiales bacterium]